MNDDIFNVSNSTLGLEDQLEEVQRACFPGLAASEIITAEHYAAHIQLFPEGQFCAQNSLRQVVVCSTMPAMT